MKQFVIEGKICKIGNNAIENWNLLSETNQDHYFFHLSKFPSCYVILETENPTKSMIKKCAEYCKQNTKYKNIKSLNVDYCKCSNVQKGDIIGEVIFISMRKVNKVKV